MKVRIISHTEPGPLPWWYSTRIGEEFEVEPDEEMPTYYKTQFEGKPYKHHIKRMDCEVIG
jgi:hypothetical protein